MTLISDQHIRGLQVITKMGTSLGKVRHIVIDTNTLELVKIEVVPSNIAKALVQGNLFISKSSIVSISEKCVVVQDAVISHQESSLASSPAVATD